MSVTLEQVKDALRFAVADIMMVNILEVTDTTTGEQLGADSLDEVEIVMRVEDELGMDDSIPDFDYDSDDTLEQVAEKIVALLNQ